MRACTKKNTWRITVGTTAVQLLQSTDQRKSFLLSPVAGGVGAAQPVVAVVFGKGANQQWTVPNGVAQLVDGYAWGAGGTAGTAGATLGGGGGGGGGFSTTGPLALIPGTVWTVNVDAAGGASQSTIVDPTATVKATATSGANAVLDAAGAGGSGAGGIINSNGGNGAAATALAGAGAGGGGAGGNDSNGSAGAGSTGGAGGGAVVLSGYGVGGAGGNGSATGVIGLPGNSPGGGAGGSGKTQASKALASDGAVVLFYSMATSQQALSISPRADVAVGQGTLNYLPGQTFPTMISDNDTGSVIKEPWYAISGVAGVVVEVTEFLYDYDPDDLAEVIAALTGK